MARLKFPEVRQSLLIDGPRRSYVAALASAFRKFGLALRTRFESMSSLTDLLQPSVPSLIHQAQFPRLAALSHELTLLERGGRSSVAIEPFETAACSANRIYLARKARLDAPRVTTLGGRRRG
jgi:hypothetical protein